MEDFLPAQRLKLKDTPLIGVVNGLAVYGANTGTLIEIETTTIPVPKGQSAWTVTGVIERRAGRRKW